MKLFFFNFINFKVRKKSNRLVRIEYIHIERGIERDRIIQEQMYNFLNQILFNYIIKKE